MSRSMILVCGATAALALATPASARPQPAAEVAAAGNAFTGGLAFIPDSVTVGVGDFVEWENTDFLVPHTATEDHELWDETGTYGGTPANPPGFGPGETRSRRFAAGGWSYFCRVHPVQMRGTVDVPVTLWLKPLSGGDRRRGRVVGARWSAESLPEGLLVDAQRRSRGGPWRWLSRGVRTRGARFRVVPGTKWIVRARVRSAADSAARSGWSPPARIRARGPGSRSPVVPASP